MSKFASEISGVIPSLSADGVSVTTLSKIVSGDGGSVRASVVSLVEDIIESCASGNKSCAVAIGAGDNDCSETGSASEFGLFVGVGSVPDEELESEEVSVEGCSSSCEVIFSSAEFCGASELTGAASTSAELSTPTVCPFER